MKKNEVYTTQIIDLTNMAYGVARIDGLVVFVPNVLPQEEVKIGITKVCKKYAYARLIKIIKPSPDRIEPVCPVADKCGGCQLQHMRYAAQLAYKQRLVQDLMPNQEVRYPLGMEDPYAYRNKAQFPIHIKNNQVFMGFYRVHSNDIVPIQQCAIQDPVINELYAWFQEHLTVSLAQGLRHLYIRYIQSTNQSQIVLIGQHKNDWEQLVKDCVSTFDHVASIVFNQNNRKDNVILGEKYEVLYGKPYILATCFENKVHLHFKSFFQVNSVQMEVLYKQALQAANLDSSMTVIDLYAGTGTIGMMAARYVKQVIGVEIVPEAVENAKENYALNDLYNGSYFCMDASVFAHEMKEKVDVVFVDPPRKGMSEQGIDDIARLNPQRVVYVSCNPKTLARDIKIFEQEGYHCEYVQPVDLFCQTNGIECVAKLEKMD